MEEKEKKNKKTQEKVIEQVEEAINTIVEKGIEPNNLDNLGKLIDIHKDIKNEEYWKAKEEYYMYRDDYMNYGNYGGGRRRDSRGRYMGDDSYGRRGVPGSGRGRYRGHEHLDNLYDDYSRYSEGREMVNRGNYGAKEDTMKSLDYMMESVACFVDMLKEEASPEEMSIITKYAKRISDM